MDTLDTFMGWAISQLHSWPRTRQVEIFESRVISEGKFHFKVRAELDPPFRIQIRFYYNLKHLDYSYQLFTGESVLRWDNKEDCGPLPTAPHHHHTDKDKIVASPLIGEPIHDWPIIKSAVEAFIDEQNKPKDRTDLLEL